MNILDHVNPKYLESRQYIAACYKNSKPFPHIVLDNFFNHELMSEIADEFPLPTDKWWHYSNQLEKKYTLDDLRDIPSTAAFLIMECWTKPFLELLECITGIDALIPDPLLNGGGLHQITRGGKLDIHADYNFHPKTKLARRVNVLIYLNKDWREEWGGNLELWDKDMTACQLSIAPKFGRMVIFSTSDTAYHGHPDPLTCPEFQSRKSIALYYYTNGRDDQDTPPHSTIYKKRPQDKDDPELDELREKRAIRRLT